ncbi:PAS domain S-box protein [Tundrisphaera lichenicola]|uniref:PAS domain S-box protein n=1 Tax=Tundrisphaera lichenicola TaxID=2029860 RepID=UPI003EC02A3E
MKRIAERKLLWGFGLSLTVLAANALISYSDLADLYASTRHVIHSRQILEEVEDVTSALKDAESARRGYLVDGDPSDLEAFEIAAKLVGVECTGLTKLADDLPGQRERCNSLRRAVHERLAELRATMDLARDHQIEAGRRRFRLDRDGGQTTRLLALAGEIEEEESRFLSSRMAERKASIWRAFATFSVASTLALILIGSIYALLRRYLSERAVSEEVIRESEARVRLLLDSAGEGVYGVDLEGRCTFCNPAALELLGFASADLVLGRNMHELTHHTRLDGSPFPAEECPIFQTFQTGQGTLGEEDVFWKADGTSIPVEYRAHPIRRGGESLGAVVTFVDIAPRLRAETEMRLRDRGLRAIAQGVFITDPADQDEPIIYVNSAFERLTGYPQSEASGRSIEFLQGEETDPSAIEELRAAFRDRREVSIEMLSYRKDGTTFWNALTLAPVEGPDGGVSHFVGVVTDVTGRKRDEERRRESEGRLRLMIESVRDYAIFAIDLKGGVSSWNGGAERLFGYADSEILGHPAECLFSPEDRASDIARRELDRAATTGRADDERWYFRKDGSRFLASVLVTPVLDESGHLLGYTKVARDITEAKKVESDLRAAKEAAEVANRAKSSFLANMSHELRTPLNAVIGYSEMLSEEAVDRRMDDLLPDLDRIHSAGKQLLGLINDVLDLSKIEAGRMELYLETFDLAELLRSVAATIQPLVLVNQNFLRIDSTAGLGLMHADQTKVRQSLLNLLSNAAKFTEKGKITLIVRRHYDADNREWVVFEVSDDGIGMTSAEVERVFLPFVQADASTTRKYGGTGLGLAITRRYCEMMGGEIKLRSELGRGSTFEMRLPAEVEQLGPEAHRIRVPSIRPPSEVERVQSIAPISNRPS